MGGLKLQAMLLDEETDEDIFCVFQYVLWCSNVTLCCIMTLYANLFITVNEVVTQPLIKWLLSRKWYGCL